MLFRSLCIIFSNIYKQLFDSWNHSDWCLSLVVFWVGVPLLLFFGLVLVFWVRGFLLRLLFGLLLQIDITDAIMTALPTICFNICIEIVETHMWGVRKVVRITRLSALALTVH